MIDGNELLELECRDLVVDQKVSLVWLWLSEKILVVKLELSSVEIYIAQ